VSHLVLVGLMATGKTTVGRLVAEDLDRPLVDSDLQIEARTGRTVRDIWRTDGEPAFRRLESAVLAEALASPVPAVIAAAGGVVLAEENRARLQRPGIEVVWLRARTATQLERVRSAQDEHRPLLDADPEGMLERMAIDRTPLYEAVADRIVDVDDRTPADIAAEILEATPR
jgi:shikimate kinase